jgi:hypothetical protein
MAMFSSRLNWMRTLPSESIVEENRNVGSFSITVTCVSGSSRLR